MTEVSPSKDGILEKGVLESEKPDQSLSGSFPSLSSGQSSEGEENPIVSSTSKVKILQFEDTLSKEDCRHFNIIYESLLLEGRAGNLTKSTLKVVLAQKPPTWLQVMYERLKHLIISSETFRNKIKFLLKSIIVDSSLKLTENNWIKEQMADTDIGKVTQLFKTNRLSKYAAQETDSSGIQVVLKYRKTLLVKNGLLYQKGTLKNHLEPVTQFVLPKRLIC